MIQILTHSGKEESLIGKEVVINRLHDAESLDMFDVNIIDLSDEKFWRCNNNQTNSINEIYDFISTSTMIVNSKTAANIILFPQNSRFCYDYWETCNKFQRARELKNMVKQMKEDILSSIYNPIQNIDIIYENTKTKVCESTLLAAFYFNIEPKKALTKSEKSHKPTTIQLDKIMLSTLKLNNYNELNSFLKAVGLIKDKQEIPEWMEDVKMFDDERQMEIIQENNRAIKVANDNITIAMDVINKNNEYKSILYTNGDELVKVVFEILEKMLGCNLSEFQDEKKEDFLFDINGNIFIGEIKGVNHNVKNENVSQLDVHYQGYFDEHEEVDPGNVKALLIMNHQKNKPLNQREKVHDQQIKLAERNKSLIVETMTLLKLFEKYLAGDITRERCIEILGSNVGLLKI